MQNHLPRICFLLIGIIAGMLIMLTVMRTTQQPSSTAATAEKPDSTPPSDAAAPQAPEQTASQPIAISAAPPVPATTVATSQPVSMPSTMPGAVSGRMMEYEQTTSGYPIAVGRRAVDSDTSGSTAYGVPNGEGNVNPTNGAPVLLDEHGNLTTPDPRPIGRNGLISNPCMDPPSVKGAAYSRAYQ